MLPNQRLKRTRLSRDSLGALLDVGRLKRE